MSWESVTEFNIIFSPKHAKKLLHKSHQLLRNSIFGSQKLLCKILTVNSSLMYLAASNVQRNAADLQILVLDVDPDAEHGYDRLLELEATVRSTALVHYSYPCRPVSEARTKLVDFQSGGRDIREHPRTKRM